MIYTVTLNPALDYVVCVPQLALGQVNRTEKEELQFGGKGINVSVMLSRLSIPNCALGFIAGFTGKALEEELRKNRISTDFICLKEGLTRINLKMKAQQETEINAKGPKIQESDIELLFQKLEQLKRGDILVLAGSVPMGVPQNIYEKMMKKVSGKGVFTVVDTNGGLLSSVLKEQPFLIKPNQIELGELLGKTLKTPQEVEGGARALQKKGARNVLVSMAGAGAMLLDENGKLHHLGAPKGVVKNSVGAGDSMVAGFLAGYLQSGDYQTALRMGTAAGSATAFSYGLAQKDEVLSLFRVL